VIKAIEEETKEIHHASPKENSKWLKEKKEIWKRDDKQRIACVYIE
jgi:hypothetical protein